jgi:hypothetical protein
VLGVIAVLGLLAVIAGVAAALNEYSGRAMDKMGEAKSGSHALGLALLSIGLAAACGLVLLYASSTANKASQSYQYQPPQPSYQSPASSLQTK